jgi:hypothetical protein
MCNKAVAPPANNNLNRFSFENLPSDILLHIFSLLDDVNTICRAGATCRRWRAISLDQGLWYRLCKVHQGALAQNQQQNDGIDWRRVYAKQVWLLFEFGS